MDGEGTDEAESVRVASGRVEGEQLGGSVLCQIDRGEGVGGSVTQRGEEGFVSVLESGTALVAQILTGLTLRQMSLSDSSPATNVFRTARKAAIMTLSLAEVQSSKRTFR